MLHSTVNIPLTKVLVKNSYLGIGEGYTWGYWYGITSVPARQFICHVMLFDGSNWYGLPLSALSTKEPTQELTLSQTQAYDCFSYDINCTRFDFLRDQRTSTRVGEGLYLFTIISHDPIGAAPFAEFPEQTKTFLFIALDSGNIIAYPNNYVTWTVTSLYQRPEQYPEYKRISETYRSET